jgi:hypothetical protein
MFLRAAPRAAGLGPDDGEQLTVGTTLVMVEGLLSGDVDAAVLNAPFDLALRRECFSPLQNAAAGRECSTAPAMPSERSGTEGPETDAR